MKLKSADVFANRHIGPSEEEVNEMLKTIGAKSLDELIDQTIPSSIRLKNKLNLPAALSEFEYLTELRHTASKNKLFRNFIGLGYYGTITPSVIARNIFHNPGWYTQYTPYQAEIAQGRLEALLNFQTMVSDLTKMEVANASLLDEGTAAAEAMIMFYNHRNKGTDHVEANVFLVSDKCFPQTIDVLKTRALPLGIEIKILNLSSPPSFGRGDGGEGEKVFGAIVQYPDANGEVNDFSALAKNLHDHNAHICFAADLLSLCLLTPPGEMGADCVVGNTQRFGVPMGFGGPHAAYFATTETFKRIIPGRIIGVSVDAQNNRALRMALQTREQHIRREKATSNICTAQALLAIMAGMYAAYHGPKGLKAIAERVHSLTNILAKEISALGYKLINKNYFDSITIDLQSGTGDKGQGASERMHDIMQGAVGKSMNFHFQENCCVSISIDETHNVSDINDIIEIFAHAEGKPSSHISNLTSHNFNGAESGIPNSLKRTSDYLTHPIFNTHHSETEMMRYIKSLENKDLSLTHSMISLGSCTMKLNAASELIPVSWDQFANIHPFAPAEQTEGYLQIIHELENYLAEITGFKATSLQPNSGAQGEYAGLLTIHAYHQRNNKAVSSPLSSGEGSGVRSVCLIPSSAHGTNPASAVMAGMKVVVTKCDDKGNIDVADLRANAEKYKDSLACLMVTYPSTHGVFEETIIEVCDIIHQHGGLVYMDGANMNAQVGLTNPATIGADVCHLNLHKTFAIPHGGGGPGMGPICVNEKLADFLPSHPLVKTGGAHGTHAVSAAPWGSASILLISYGYIKMLGGDGCTDASKYAILNANYIKARLEKEFQILYQGKNGRCAHEMIVDLRPFKHTLHVEAEDVAKRLMDYNFHAPTVSFPVAGTIMIEPTESESKAELDRFCDALLSIREEIREIENGADQSNNVLKNAPHTMHVITADDWKYPYPRTKAAFPLPYVRANKFWPSVSRVNNTYGDRNLICVCPPVESYASQEALI